MNLPAEVKKLLEQNAVGQEEAIFSVLFDISDSGEYEKGYVVLLADKLLVFRGKQSEPAIYELQEIEKIEVENGIGCNMLIVRTENGVRYIARFSNSCLAKMLQLKKGVEQLKKGEDFEPPKEEEVCCPKCGKRYPDPARKTCPGCMDKRTVFLRVLGYFKPYIPHFVLMCLTIIGTALLNLVWPYLNGEILYDRVLAKDNRFLDSIGLPGGEFVTALLLLVLAMAATKVVLLLFQIIHGVLTAHMVVNVVRDMKKSVFRKMGQLSISFFRSRQTGGLMTRVIGDADHITGFFVDGAPYILVHCLTFATTLVVMIGINWKMTLVTLLTLPMLLLTNRLLRPKIWIMHGRRHRAERSVNSSVNDNLTGARVVKSFGREVQEIQRFGGSNRKLRDAETHIAYRRSFFDIVYGSAQSIMDMSVWFLGVYLLLGKQEMELGTLITFAGYVGQLRGPLNFMSFVPNWWAESMNSAQRIFEIIDAIPEVKEAENPIPLTEPKGEVELRNVTFGYEAARPVLKDVSLHIKPGSMLGIIGRSGAGKTTLVNLISRMYDTQEGQILIDGIDVRELASAELRKNVSMVSQDTYIFMGTVAENIAYANPGADHADVVHAAKLAGAHDFIMKMPDGYDTYIGSSGRSLSGGERQRISIARAILSNPKILILDEATAAVDTETERIIQKSLQYLVKGRTTISIAHRLSTLRDADYLVVVEDGKITEQGTHEELEQLHGIYYKLMQLQTKALAVKE